MKNETGCGATAKRSIQRSARYGVNDGGEHDQHRHGNAHMVDGDDYDDGDRGVVDGTMFVMMMVVVMKKW